MLAANGWTLQAAAGGKDNLENAVLEIGKDGAPPQKIENDATNGYLHAAFTLLGDGSRLVTGGNDGTLIEYDSASAVISGEFKGGHSGEINAIAVSEKANLMVTGSADQTIRLWNLEDARADRQHVLCRQGIRDLDAAGLLLLLRRRRQADRLACQPGPRQGRPLHPRRAAQEVSMEPRDGAAGDHPEKRQRGGP